MSLGNVVKILEDALFGNRIKVSTSDDLKTYTHEFATAQTALVVATPATGKKLVPKNIGLACDGNTGAIKFFWATSGKPIAVMYASAFTHSSLVGITNMSGAVGESIALTTTTSTSNVFVGIDYEEIDG